MENYKINLCFIDPFDFNMTSKYLNCSIIREEVNISLNLIIYNTNGDCKKSELNEYLNE